MFDKVPPRNRHRPRNRYFNRLRRTNRQSFPSATILRILISAAHNALSETTTEGKASTTQNNCRFNHKDTKVTKKNI